LGARLVTIRNLLIDMTVMTSGFLRMPCAGANERRNPMPWCIDVRPLRTRKVPHITEVIDDRLALTAGAASGRLSQKETRDHGPSGRFRQVRHRVCA